MRWSFGALAYLVWLMDLIRGGVFLTRRLSRHIDPVLGHYKMPGPQIVNGSELDPGDIALVFRISINLLGSAGEGDHCRNDGIGLGR